MRIRSHLAITLTFILFAALSSLPFYTPGEASAQAGQGAGQEAARKPEQKSEQELTRRPPEALVREAMAAYEKKDYALSARLFAAAIDGGADAPDDFYNAACSSALAGDKESAFRYLTRSIRAGFRNAEHLKRDSDLDSLHTDARWAGIVAECERAQAKYIEEHRDPSRVKFVTEDIARFWSAYDRAMLAPAAERQAILERDYIKPGTIGLKDFARSGRLDARTLAAKLASHAAFYKAIRALTVAVDAEREATLAAFARLKEIYPEAIFPDAYFVIGQMMSGGTASQNGLLMGAELFVRSESAPVPVDELNDWEKGAIMPQSDIPPLVAHEAIHFQQRYSAPNNLLCQALREGSADFLGELTSGRLTERIRQTHAWANAREQELWQEFQKEMDGPIAQRWFAGGLKEGRPPDLAYWMGYKISQAYYRNARDKREAVRAMLVVSDCKQFLRDSGYGR